MRSFGHDCILGYLFQGSALTAMDCINMPGKDCYCHVQVEPRSAYLSAAEEIQANIYLVLTDAVLSQCRTEYQR